MTRANSTISLSGEASAHVTLDGNPCPGTIFWVVAVGTGLPDQYKCKTCERILPALGDQERIIDPLNKK